jgi:acetylornithine deacetylase/succinyl-diaminopimelate desuccinylase-like protein
MALDVVTLLADLVRIPSVNPMGRPVHGDMFFEHRLTAFLENLFRGLGLPVERHTVAPLRDNLITRVDGDPPVERGGRIVMFEAHQDTVPVDGMTIEPFTPRIEAGRLYGRGACDIKGGMAAMIAALARLAHDRPPGRPTVVLACTVNEEHGFTGAAHWAATYAGRPIDSGHGPEAVPPPGRTALLPRIPDAAIVAEPTQLDVVVAHKGAVRWRAITHGLATHSSQPHLGRNAIYRMAQVVQCLERYAHDVVPHLAAHRLCGRPTLSVGLIQGGLSVNTVPDRCTIEIDRRVLPVEDPSQALAHCLAHLRSELSDDFPLTHEPPFMATRGLMDGANASLAERLGDLARQRSGRGTAVGVPYGTDAPHFAATGCPTVVFGPGSIDQAHTADEWLDLTQLEAAADILYHLVAGAW